MTPVACAEELLEGIADANWAVFEESGHFPFIEETTVFVDTVDAFLNG